MHGASLGICESLNVDRQLLVRKAEALDLGLFFSACYLSYCAMCAVLLSCNPLSHVFEAKKKIFALPPPVEVQRAVTVGSPGET